MAAKRKRKQTLNQFIINKFLSNSKAIWKNKGFVAREMKFTKDLIEKYNSNPQQKARNRRVEITFLAPNKL